MSGRPTSKSPRARRGEIAQVVQALGESGEPARVRSERNVLHGQG